jgi:DNA-binding CsgD family transcriptional regulator
LRGLALSEVANRLAPGTGTVRSHPKRVYDKTGVHNQAALVALIRGFSNPCA